MRGREDLLTRKYLFLERLKVMSASKDWNLSGRNILGMWRKVPDGISSLRKSLSKMPARDFNIMTQEKDVNRLFDQAMEVLRKKQMPYKFIGKRLVSTQEFYTSFYEEGLGIYSDNDAGIKNDKVQLRS